MIYCPVCNLWGVPEDHAINFHGRQGYGTGTQPKDIIYRLPCCPCRDPTKGSYIGDCFCGCHKAFDFPPPNQTPYWNGDTPEDSYRTTSKVMS